MRISNALDVATISRAMLSRRNLALMHRTAVLKVISLVVLSSLTQGCAGLSERSTASEDFAYFLGTNTMQSPNVNNNLNDALSNPRPFEGIFSAVGLTVLHQTTQEVRNLLQRKLPREENNPEDDLEKPPPVDPAMANKGGIDLTPARMNLRTSADGTAIVFHIDPAQLARWQKAPGFEPEIISMRQLDSVAEFLGIAVGHG